MSFSDFEALLDLSSPEITGVTQEERQEAALQKIRHLILTQGLPEEDGVENDRTDGLRGRVWKVLLRIPAIDTTYYWSLVKKKHSAPYEVIRDDTFRTFHDDIQFKQGVPEVRLVRLLNAFVHSVETNKNLGYVQGMSVLAAPFIYVMPEVDAFFCFRRMLLRHCPNYVYPMLEGVHAGVALLDEVLHHCDPQLFAYLASKGLNGQISLSSVMTFLGCSPPIGSCSRSGTSWPPGPTWPSLRGRPVRRPAELISEKNPLPILHNLPLDAKRIITTAISLAHRVPDDLYGRLVRHPWDPYFVEEVQRRIRSQFAPNPSFQFTSSGTPTPPGPTAPRLAPANTNATNINVGPNSNPPLLPSLHPNATPTSAAGRRGTALPPQSQSQSGDVWATPIRGPLPTLPPGALDELDDLPVDSPAPAPSASAQPPRAAWQPAPGAPVGLAGGPVLGAGALDELEEDPPYEPPQGGRSQAAVLLPAPAVPVPAPSGGGAAPAAAKRGGPRLLTMAELTQAGAALRPTMTMPLSLSALRPGPAPAPSAGPPEPDPFDEFDAIDATPAAPREAQAQPRAQPPAQRKADGEGAPRLDDPALSDAQRVVLLQRQVALLQQQLRAPPGPAGVASLPVSCRVVADGLGRLAHGAVGT
ncbi:putative bub2 protein [Paratrimastix pyriformis]|uniref:Bub2 protein n=1 Tax=Paratrimastix pyriformis TaxID=342808 RepID=A0ABQ8UK88_9EUKA|nr:putative bub2 protein [Paratrimastix pyriformis]